MNPENEKIIIENPEVNEKDNETKVVVNEQIIDDTLEFLDKIDETERKETIVESKIEEQEEKIEFTIENAEPSNDAPLPEHDSIDSIELEELTPEENTKVNAEHEKTQDEIYVEEFADLLNTEVNLDGLTPEENEKLDAELGKIQEEIFKEEIDQTTNGDVDLDQLSPEENAKLDEELEKIKEEIFKEEIDQIINSEVDLDQLTPEENAKLDEELEKIQEEIFKEKIEQIINSEVDLDQLTPEVNAKLDAELEKLQEEIDKEAAPEPIVEAETRPETPNTTIIEDEAPLPDQEEILPQTKKDEKVVIAVEGVTDLMPNTDTELKEIAPKEIAQKEAPKPLSEVDKSLNEVSRASGLNLKAYFIEDNKKEIENLKASGKVQTFEFNGDLKSFYRDAYRYVLESNMIARQLNPDNKNFPDITKLTEKFEKFMKNVGQELKDRNQIEEYVPFGGLTAHEIKQIQKDVLLNRPQTREEALQRNASKLGGKNYEEKIDNAYELAHKTIESNFGKDYKVGENPKLDQAKLQNSIDTINGAKAIHDNQKIWEPYKPKFGLPNFNKPIWRHLISNAFKLIGQGIKIALDCAIVFPITNAAKAITYPFEKLEQSIRRDYNIRKLKEELVAKGFTHAQINEKLLENNSKTLDIEKDSKNIDKQFEKNLKTIKEYKEEKEKQNKVEKTDVKDVEIQKQENLEINPNKQQIVVIEAETKLYDGDITPKIEDKQVVKTNDLKI